MLDPLYKTGTREEHTKKRLTGGWWGWRLDTWVGGAEGGGGGRGDGGGWMMGCRLGEMLRADCSELKETCSQEQPKHPPTLKQTQSRTSFP